MKILMAANYYNHMYRIGDSHLAENFSEMGHEVLYVSGPLNIFSIRHLFKQGPLKTDYKNAFESWARGGMCHNDKLLEYCPLTLLPISNRLPFGRSKLALFRNITLTLPSLYRYIRRKGFSDPDLLIVSQLQFSELLERIDAKKKILRLTDDAASFKTVPSNIKILEEWAVQKADYVVTTSRPLQNRLQSLRKDIEYLPNAVDYEFYQAGDRSEPLEYTNLKGTKIIYIGTIDYWFDVDLIEFLATENPKFNFLLIGNPRVCVEQLRCLENVHLLGPKPYQELPKYLWNADVGIIPFKRIPLIESVSPLKMYEYLACGLPVVTTKWKELEGLKPPVLFADSQKEFNQQLLKAIGSSGKEEDIAKNTSFARGNSWRERANTLLTLAVGSTGGR